MVNTFRVLEIDGWRQFGAIRLDFHPRLTVLTGANATGKSTILGILARHFQWSRSYSPSPFMSDDHEGFWAARGRHRHTDVEGSTAGWGAIGSLQYSNGQTTQIEVPSAVDEKRNQYELRFTAQQDVSGMFLDSHRSVSGNYSPVDTIPVVFSSSSQYFDQFVGEIRTRWLGSYSARTPQRALKETLIAAAAFSGDGGGAVDAVPLAATIWNGFQQVLRDLLPSSLGFRRLRVRTPDLVVEAESGDFVIDDASGGVSAIIEIAWQIFLRAQGSTAFTVLMDEPENHLHPQLQREILPRLLNAFPDVQFIVATHSPFVVTSSRDSEIYALDYFDKNEVESRRLDYVNKAASAEETLKRVLGLETTLPTWAAEEFEQVVSAHLKGSMTEDDFRALREDLLARGLQSQFTDALLGVIDTERPSD